MVVEKNVRIIERFLDKRYIRYMDGKQISNPPAPDSVSRIRGILTGRD